LSDVHLKKALDRLYDSFDFESRKYHDPVAFPHRYKAKKDKEVVAFISALFAYGKVDLFRLFLEKVFAVMGTSPYSFIMEFDKRRDSIHFRGLRYRFNGYDDIILLIQVLKAVLSDEPSLDSLFQKIYDRSGQDMRKALTGYVDHMHDIAGRLGVPGTGFRHMLPSPVNGSACKRLNLFCRWMVRDRDIDLGIWKGIPKNKLIIPLDTHIARIGRCLELTHRKSVDWKTAEKITESLKRFDPDDPLKYDFALCHQGIMGICREEMKLCRKCTLNIKTKSYSQARRKKEAMGEPT
jgi:uncharacterized protein (TIGR02757 family)